MAKVGVYPLRAVGDMVMAMTAMGTTHDRGESRARYRWRETVVLHPSRFGFNCYDREGRRIVSVQGRNADLIRSLALGDAVVASGDPAVAELLDLLLDFGLVEPVEE